MDARPISFGLAQFWSQGDAVIQSVAVLLLLMSVASWTVIIGKALAYLRFRLSAKRALAAFWSAESPQRALEALRRSDKLGVFADVAHDAWNAATAYARQMSGGASASLPASEFITRALQQSLATAQSRIERGLTVLASIGATAPFVGLFGTVWGIYHALIGLTGATQVVLEKVAGPVGEALIMTAAGLFVAVPAVLAYNACVRANRVVLARVHGFASSVNLYLAHGLRPVA
jgi:biopolymer transport protein ExbB